VTEQANARDVTTDDAIDGDATSAVSTRVVNSGNTVEHAELPDPADRPVTGASIAAAARYGRPRTGRRATVRKYTLIGAGVAALTAVVGYFGLRDSSPPITATVLGYTVSSEHSVTVRFEVVKQASKAAVCVVEAPDVHSDIVGRQVVDVPAGQSHVTLSTTLRTTTLAIMGEVEQSVTSTS
jgi:hypothetical protein